MTTSPFSYAVPSPPKRLRRISDKIVTRRFEIVGIHNSPFCQLLKRSDLAQILKCSTNTITRDLEWMSKYQLLFPLRINDELPYMPSETRIQFIKRFLEAHGVPAVHELMD